jgi:hypothetical protein
MHAYVRVTPPYTGVVIPQTQIDAHTCTCTCTCRSCCDAYASVALSFHRHVYIHTYTHTGVQNDGCTAFWLLSLGSTARSSKIIKCGGHEAIMTALRTHPNNAHLAQNACTALHNLGTTGSPEMNDRVVCTAGGAAHVIAAMNTHMGDHRVLSVCCFALAGFSSVNSTRCDRIVRDGGVEVLIKAMNRYRDHVLLQVCMYVNICVYAHIRRGMSGRVYILIKALKQDGVYSCRYTCTCLCLYYVRCVVCMYVRCVCSIN